MRAIFQSLPGLINELPSVETRQAIVFAVWPTVLGEHLRERSAPLSFENGTLSVAVKNAEWKREFAEHASQIVYKLNRAFGTSLVERIVTIVDAKAAENSKRKPSKLKDDNERKHSVSDELKNASLSIANAELRANFLEAAAACIDRRNAK